MTSQPQSRAAEAEIEAPPRGRWANVVNRLLWTPPWLKWDSSANHDLTWAQNIIFGFAAAFSVANLYYNHPILNVLAEDFNVTDERSSLVPTIMQAGYAAGLLFVIPIGDIVRRRPLILGLIFVTAVLWLGLTLTHSFEVFLGISFLVGMLTVTPQLMFPLAVQYAPQRHRATMISIVMSGLVFGILIARLLSGIITQYSSWRSVYWMSFGLQIAIFTLLFCYMPDYPILRPDGSYLLSLLSIVKMPFKHPILTQCSLIAFFTMAMFTSFWTTLTFQLAGPPFNLSTLTIGLFALIGISPVFLNPVVSRLLTSRIHTSGTLIIAIIVTEAAVVIGTFVGTFSLAGPVIWAFFGDLGMNTIVVANRMAFANVDTKAQNAVNSVYMVLTFCGQLFGTAVGNKLYASGGWIHSGALSIGLVEITLILILIRGPHEKGWIEEKPQERPGQDVEAAPSPATNGFEKSDAPSGQSEAAGDATSVARS
ncbi:major facilitator superfamily domain-containing protein [Truncatella angustata]|uniref:Major facilitator superfamily domain-containing protein n=1 Tax=Truncatella angustata TaxID=152316 RepID=A0A9P8RPE6_9PEZI|nr:major facilitator superfamily domain-containing protein [Truncatella angustata]KAH6647748.1 major facilitator superfamily domain-containing protein [Truncatella angustata]